MNKRKILWDKETLNYFRDTIQYIRKDSTQNADKVKKQILQKIAELSKQPDIHNPDKFKINNDGSFRAFELHHIWVEYKIKEQEIIITRIRNTYQEPLDY